MTAGILLSLAALGTLAGVPVGRIAPRLWLGLTVGAMLCAIAAAAEVTFGGGTWAWQSTFVVAGGHLRFLLDPLSALFVLLLGVVGGCATVFGRGYWSDEDHPRSAASGRAWWNLFLLTMGLVLVNANGLHFLVTWELFALSGYALITLRRDTRAVREAGWLYLVASHAGTLALFGFFTLLASKTGSWALGPMRDRSDLAPLFWLALAGFGVKAGLFPLHVWLPAAHANAPSHVSALLSGMAIKVGIYGILRFAGWLPVPSAAGWTIVVIGLASAVLGVAFALGQHDLKRLLAYHSVENIGIILIGTGFAVVATQHGNPAWGALALVAALLHVWNHGLFKSLLFLGAGSVLHATGTRTMSRLGGLWRRMPWTTGLFALGAAAISGLPPLNGFVSEWLLYLGLFGAAQAHGPSAWAAIPAAILLGITGALALACFSKVCGIVFLGTPRSRSATLAEESGALMTGPMLVLAAACATIGLVPFAVWPALSRAAACWNPAWPASPAPTALCVLGGANLAIAGTAGAAALLLLGRLRKSAPRRAPTWDCGYVQSSPRIQYTAGSFAATIVEWFAPLLRSHRAGCEPDGPFPAAAGRTGHTPETVLEYLVEPAAALVLSSARLVRRLQHGRVQAYLLYLVAGIVLLAWLTVSTR